MQSVPRELRELIVTGILSNTGWRQARGAFRTDLLQECHAVESSTKSFLLAPSLTSSVMPPFPPSSLALRLSLWPGLTIKMWLSNLSAVCHTGCSACPLYVSHYAIGTRTQRPGLRSWRAPVQIAEPAGALQARAHAKDESMNLVADVLKRKVCMLKGDKSEEPTENTDDHSEFYCV